MPTATLPNIREDQRLDRIAEASQEIHFWKRQERVRTTLQGRAHATKCREAWTRRLTELQTSKP